MSNSKKIIIIIISGLLCMSLVIGFLILSISKNNQVVNQEKETNTDTTPPNIKLNAEQNESGVYFITLIKGSENIKNFNAMSLVESVSDDTSLPDNITIECNDILDESANTQYITYSVIDEAGNMTIVKLLVIINEDPELAKQEKKDEIADMQEEIDKLKAEEEARLEQERQEQEKREQEERERQEQNNPPKQEPDTPISQPTTPEQPDPPKPPQNIYHTVNNFTIHDISEIQSAALQNCSYGGCGGTLAAYNFDLGDTQIVIHWNCTCGWTGTSIAYIQ